jgi:hypothetical protein
MYRPSEDMTFFLVRVVDIKKRGLIKAHNERGAEKDKDSEATD